MKRPQLVSSGTILRLRQQAEQAWHDRNLSLCVELLERASKLDPANVAVLLQLGRMQGLCYNYTAAEEAFTRAVRIVPNKAEIFAAVAQQSRDFYDTRLVESYLRLAAQEKNAAPEILIKLAEVYERMRRTEEAEALLERVLQKSPNFPAALLGRARLCRQAKRLEAAESYLRSAIPNADKETKVKSWYELGAVLDQQGRYDEAMTAFLEAKAILRRDAAPHFEQLKRVRKHLEQMREQLSGEVFQRWADEAADLQPARRIALLCGHPRSGTTLLEQVLDSHPDIVSAEETTHFTDYAYSPIQRTFPIGTPMLRILDSAPIDLLRSGRSDYFRASELCLNQPLNDRLLVDKNPSLTFTIPAMVRVFPEIKILMAIRDPRDVCLSCFMQPFFPVQQVSSAYLSLETTVDEYVALMSMWRTVAPLLKNQTLEIHYENMVDDLELVTRTALDFLEITWNQRVLDFNQHAKEKIVRSPTYSDVTHKVFTRARGRWRNYERYLSRFFDKLKPFIRPVGYCS